MILHFSSLTGRAYTVAPSRRCVESVDNMSNKESASTFDDTEVSGNYDPFASNNEGIEVGRDNFGQTIPISFTGKDVYKRPRQDNWRRNMQNTQFSSTNPRKEYRAPYNRPKTPDNFQRSFTITTKILENMTQNPWREQELAMNLPHACRSIPLNQHSDDKQ